MLGCSSYSGQELQPLLELLAVRIRQHRSELSDRTELSLAPDMTDIAGTLDGELVLITNEFHSARGLRKVHLEIAWLGRGLQILHCVFFPDPRFDLPIFGADVVAGPGGISAAIVDLSPVKSDLPFNILQQLEQLSMPSFSQERDLPGWGSIFSPFVHFIRPVDTEEENIFLNVVDLYLGILTSESHFTSPDTLDSPSTIERFKGQQFYCLQQKRNDKTRSVLTKTFDCYWAERYMDEVLFDFPPLL